MIQIIPSLAIMDGKCVRLRQGNFDDVQVYDENPLDLAKSFEDHGIQHLHMIDLEGSKQGKTINFDMLYMIAKTTNLKISYGGGLANDEDIVKTLEYGATQATLGTIAVKDRELVASWLISFGRNKIMLSADALDGIIHVSGWQRKTNILLTDFISFFHDRGVQYVKCSDIARDGLMKGPNFELYRKLVNLFPALRFIASGGISKMDDIKRLADIGVYGVIVGKALYEKAISLHEIENYITSSVNS
ncbi:MAG: 1-(5-phosphoribosyl)-5-[(5-phosphoribosylamino)methylideneamino] imidazole-4-carboxamide isomerase [Cytophagales bacterium]|nr:1-(5-phosphoribosyl)-5-[(5-phosphoribosylamino)methylideneamino] imidazole-4-carboxamide isomerase [Cytophagales bacterium]MDW8384280.1 1-(5-phosphoribosyl)-5-[(5-phosphoribosylamino)methylideneamino] imidazole-4-carboxamide isomerase [Flammeovirgaceae bacterium]